MTVQDLETLFDYGYWANGKLFEVVSRLTPEQFTRTVDGSHGSVRNTLVHVLSAEWVWLGRVGGQERGATLNPADFPTAESIAATWKAVETHLREFLSTLQDQDLARDIEFVIGGTKKLSMPVGELLQQAANHGVHHRGQVSLLLRLLGYSPENFDILLYFAERHRLRAS
ncbi:DinB family protein [Fimbriiglobus ruber]|uniref:DinB protein n=1 Tax=Fimbriiglobus ruber TaxID=1908690 RepID=A0A225DQH8_9BACT|nr:DinB family protein [Fimbriiglobus ruber]OWK41864.1 DinB protein [Fimbriiglobus ruber]